MRTGGLTTRQAGRRRRDHAQLRARTRATPRHSTHPQPPCQPQPQPRKAGLTHAQEQHVVGDLERVARAAVRARRGAALAAALAAGAAGAALALVLVLQRLADGAGVDAAGDGAALRVDGHRLGLEELALQQGSNAMCRAGLVR